MEKVSRIVEWFDIREMFCKEENFLYGALEEDYENSIFKCYNNSI